MISFHIAKRFVLSNKTQSLLIVAGIAVGVSVQMFIGILIDSLQKSLVDRTIGASPHITVTTDDNRIDSPNEILKIAQDENGVVIARSVTNSNTILNDNQKNYPLLTKGLDLDQSSIYKIEDNIYSGRKPGDNEILLGKNLAEEGKIGLGKEVFLSLPDGRKQGLTVSGFFDMKNAAINKTWGFITPQTSDEIDKRNGSVSAIELQVDKVFAADTIAADLETKLPHGLKITNWKTENAELLNALSSQSLSSYMIQAFVLLSVVIAIASVLSITVMQKSKQIGILKAMGITDGRSSQIFIYQSFFLGTAGAIVGAGLGLLLFFAFNTFAKNPDGSKVVEPYFRWVFFNSTIAVVIVASTLAGIGPALKSKRLNPIDIIRNN